MILEMVCRSIQKYPQFFGYSMQEYTKISTYVLYILHKVWFSNGMEYAKEYRSYTGICKGVQKLYRNMQRSTEVIQEYAKVYRTYTGICKDAKAFRSSKFCLLEGLPAYCQ